MTEVAIDRQRLRIMRFIKTLSLVVWALTFATISSSTETWAQAKKIKVGYSSDAPGSLVTWLARETGIFAKNGLDVELVRTRTTVGGMALLSGELDFIQASGPGASLVATEFALDKLGLKSKDVKFIVVGGTPERLIALRNKLLQATLLSPPTSIVAEKEGFNSLADVGALGLPFLHNGIALSRRVIRDNPAMVRRY